MKLIHQTKFGEEQGNCMQACLAMVLGADLQGVPNFCENKDTWRDDMLAWLDKFEITLMSLSVGALGDHLSAGEIPVGWPETFFLIGQSPRGDYLHAVVMHKGQLFDPHPSGEGLKTVEMADILAVKRPAESLVIRRSKYLTTHG